MTSFLDAVQNAMLDLLFPRACVVCDVLCGGSGLVCAPCWAKLPVLPHPQCDRCGHPTYGESCKWCALLPVSVAYARSLCWVPEGIGGAVTHQLKYGGWTALGEEIADRFARHRPPWSDTERAVLVPVPLGRARLRERGYNQSGVLANALANRWGVPAVADALVRIRETASQVLLTPAQRSANVHGAFAAGLGAGTLRDAHVVLVDDVVTTAGTLNACAGAAMAAGAATISYVTFGRARAAFDRTPHPRSEKGWQSALASTASAASVVRFSAPQRNAASATSTLSRSTT